MSERSARTRTREPAPVVQRRTSERDGGVRLQPPSYGIQHADTAGVAMPTPVRSRMEHAFGVGLADVRIHEGPLARSIGAQAFTRGNHIHFAPGEWQPHSRAGQRVLGHELAHVVQQAQGRAQPSMRVGGMGIDASPQLEHEAEQAGTRAAEGRASGLATNTALSSSAGSPVVQCRVVGDTFKQFLTWQGELQQQAKDNPDDHKYMYTTVGFEHEFGQMTDGPLHGVDHFEISASNAPAMPYTGLPFMLETDAANAVELVSPPFLLPTKSSGVGHWKSSRKPVPMVEDVQAVDNMIRGALRETVKEHRAPNPEPRPPRGRGHIYNPYVETPKTLAEFAVALQALTGINFPINADVDVEAFQLSPAGTTRFDAVAGVDGVPVSPSRIPAATLQGIHVKPSMKGGGITTQVNFATDAATAHRMQREADADRTLRPGDDGDRIVETFRKAEDDIRTALVGAGQVSNNLQIFYAALARALSGQIAVPYMAAFRDLQLDAQGQHVRMRELDDLSADAMSLAESISSHVKDTSSVWVKDMVLNIGLGVLERAEWLTVLARVGDAGTTRAIVRAVDVNVSNKWPENRRIESQAMIRACAREALTEVARAIREDIRPDRWWGFSDRMAALHFGQRDNERRLDFAEHRRRDIGPRQDTYIRSPKVQTPLWDRRLHVVETRANIGEALKLLGKVGG